MEVTPTREKPRNVRFTREREGDDLNEELLKEKRNEDRQNAKLSKPYCALETLQKETETLEKEKQDLRVELSKEKRITERQKAAISKAETCIQNLQLEKKRLENEKHFLQRQQQQLRNEVREEKHTSEINKQDHTKLNEKIKELEGIRKELERQQKKMKDSLVQEKRKVSLVERSRFQLNGRITELEGIRTELESQQKKLKENLAQVKEKVTLAERSRVQVVTNLKKVEERNRKLEEEVTKIKEKLLAAERTSKELQTSSLKLKERIKELEGIRKEIKRQQKKLKDDLVQEKRRVTREERSRGQLNEIIKELEGKITELKSQRKKLQDSLVQGKRNVSREERSRVQGLHESSNKRTITKDTVAVSTENMKTCIKRMIDEISDNTAELTKQKNDVTEELETTKSTLNKKEEDCLQIQEELDDAISKKMDLEKTLTKTEELYQTIEVMEKEIQQLKMRLIKAQTELENSKTQVTILQDRRNQLEKYLSREQERSQELGRLLLKAYASSFEYNKTISQMEDANNRLKIEYEKAEKKQELLSDILENLDRDALILKTESEIFNELLLTEEKQQNMLVSLQSENVTKEEGKVYPTESQLQGDQDNVEYEFFTDMFESTDNLQEVLHKRTLSESIDTIVKAISNGKDKLRKFKDSRDNTVEESEVQRDWFELSELQVSMVVSQDGGKLKIPGSDVSLHIPAGALQEQREIQMKIIPHCLDPGGDSLSFSSNSSVVVELLPNNLQFQRTVHLRLPHCLHLNDKYNSKTDVEVLISHHEKGDIPKWDASTDTACKLQKDHCVVRLKKFCWITYRVHDKVVTAKRLKIFTAGRDLELSDRVSEVEVGYFPDLPGSGEILRQNPKLRRGQIKPFLFRKDEEESTLLISLQQVIPTEWQNNIELGDQQIISYQSICTGTEMSCPFHLQYTPEGSPSGKVPLCLFYVTQKNAEQINITFRPEVKCDED